MSSPLTTTMFPRAFPRGNKAAVKSLRRLIIGTPGSQNGGPDASAQRAGEASATPLDGEQEVGVQQDPVTQSAPTAHRLSTSHGAHPPPQSTSVSEPFLIPSTMHEAPPSTPASRASRAS